MSLTDQLSNSNNRIVEDVWQIACQIYPQLDKQQLKNVIWMHWFYGTLDVIYRGNKLVAAVRWNISQSGQICDVLDWYVDANENGSRIMKHLIARNWHRFPAVKYLRFFRSIKYPDRKPKLYTLKQILHLKGA